MSLLRAESPKADWLLPDLLLEKHKTEDWFSTVVETCTEIDIDEISKGNLQSYWTIARLMKLTLVLDYCRAYETYIRIGLLQGL